MSWNYKARMPSVNLFRFGRETDISRHRFKDAFVSFLLTLCFRRENDMSDMFSCKKCESSLPCGKRRFDGVVMDGAAVGILGNLPGFQRDE